MTEGLQLLAMGREASWRDVGMDGLGAGLGLVLAQAVPSRRVPIGSLSRQIPIATA